MSSPTPPALLSIIAYARAGALEEAWRRLEAGGFSAEDPAALTVRGRLLKDRALAASGEARAALKVQLAELRELYRGHIRVEDEEIFPWAGRVLSVEEVRGIGEEMRRRRGT